MKKQGAGRSNWGRADEQQEGVEGAEGEKRPRRQFRRREPEAENAEAKPADAPAAAAPATSDKPAEASTSEKKPEENADGRRKRRGERELTEEEKKEEEENAKLKTFAEYEKELATMVQGPPKQRSVSKQLNEEWKNAKPLNTGDMEYLKLAEKPAQKKKAAATTTQKKDEEKHLSYTELFKDVDARRSRGRGNKNSARRGGQERPPNVTNNEDFPVLPSKKQKKAQPAKPAEVKA